MIGAFLPPPHTRKNQEDRSLKASLARREEECELASGVERPKTKAVAEMRAAGMGLQPQPCPPNSAFELADGLDRFAAQIGFRRFFWCAPSHGR